MPLVQWILQNTPTPLYGEVDGATTGAANLSGTQTLSGRADGVSTGSGALSGTQTLTGQANGVSSPTSALSGTQALTASSAGVASTTADLDNTESGAVLAGESDGVASATGAIDLGTQSLIASSAGTATGSAALALTQALSASTTAVSGAAGALSGTQSLAGSSAGAASVPSAAANFLQPLLGSTAGGASATAQLALGFQNLTASATGAAAGLSELSGTQALTGSSAGEGTADGNLGVFSLMQGRSDGVGFAPALSFSSLELALDVFVDGFALARALHMKVFQVLGNGSASGEAITFADLDLNRFAGRADGVGTVVGALTLGPQSLFGSSAGIAFVRERRTDLDVILSAPTQRTSILLINSPVRGAELSYRQKITITLQEEEMIQGNVITLTAVFRDATGELFDPSAVDLRVRAGAVMRQYTYSGGGITRLSAGVFSADLLIEESGKHFYSFRSVAPGEEAAAESYFLVQASAF